MAVISERNFLLHKLITAINVKAFKRFSSFRLVNDSNFANFRTGSKQIENKVRTWLLCCPHDVCSFTVMLCGQSSYSFSVLFCEIPFVICAHAQFFSLSFTGLVFFFLIRINASSKPHRKYQYFATNVLRFFFFGFLCGHRKCAQLSSDAPKFIARRAL